VFEEVDWQEFKYAARSWVCPKLKPVQAEQFLSSACALDGK